MARVARRPGLRVKGGIIKVGDDEMALVSDLAAYGRVNLGDRPLYQGGPGSLNAFDRELVRAHEAELVFHPPVHLVASRGRLVRR